jgi:predicted DNA-binding transcriptional regulator AlpA
VAHTHLPDLMTLAEFAELMRWSDHTVHQRRYRGASLPRSVKVAGRVLFPRDDVLAWLQEHTEDGEAA